jgi:cellulose synthase (UDP-forming)
MGNCMMKISPAGYDVAYKGLALGWIWSTYNLALIGIALLVMLDLPKPDLYEWFTLQRVVRISHDPELPVYDSRSQAELEFPMSTGNIPSNTYWGTTAAISEVGAQILLTQAGIPQLRRGEIVPIALEIMEEGIKLKGVITQSTFDGEFRCINVRFEQVTLAQHRQLVAMLFCRPGQWKRQNSPGELLSLWLLLRSLVRPRALFGKRDEISAIAVTQT